MKPYQHPHYHKIFKGRQEDQYQHYQGIRWNTHSWNMALQNHYSTRYYHIPKSTTNWRSFNNNTWNRGKQNYATTNHQLLRPKRIDFGWMDHHQWKEERRNFTKSYYLVSSHVKPLIAKLWGQRFLKEGTMLWPKGGHIWG